MFMRSYANPTKIKYCANQNHNRISSEYPSFNCPFCRVVALVLLSLVSYKKDRDNKVFFFCIEGVADKLGKYFSGHLVAL